MDPILEEMARVKNVAEIRPARYRDWVRYLAERLARLEQLEAGTDAKARAKAGAA